MFHRKPVKHFTVLYNTWEKFYNHRQLAWLMMQSVMLRAVSSISASQSGLIENAGRENYGPSKLQDMKLMDQCAVREIAGRENDGPICRT